MRIVNTRPVFYAIVLSILTVMFFCLFGAFLLPVFAEEGGYQCGFMPDGDDIRYCHSTMPGLSTTSDIIIQTQCQHSGSSYFYAMCSDVIRELGFKPVEYSSLSLQSFLGNEYEVENNNLYCRKKDLKALVLEKATTIIQTYFPGCVPSLGTTEGSIDVIQRINLPESTCRDALRELNTGNVYYLFFLGNHGNATYIPCLASLTIEFVGDSATGSIPAQIPAERITPRVTRALPMGAYAPQSSGIERSVQESPNRSTPNITIIGIIGGIGLLLILIGGYILWRSRKNQK